MIKILRNLALFWVKNANFLPNRSAKMFKKNHNIGPWSYGDYSFLISAVAISDLIEHLRKILLLNDFISLTAWA
jgi:hypothetical protein